MGFKNKSIFFDKDGVLNKDKGVKENFDTPEIISNAGDVIAYFVDRGLKIFVITNQPIIARGLMTEKTLKKKFEKFQLMLLHQNKRAKVDKFYYCPHHPNANLAEYRKNCECRKPKPGMILQAAKEYNLDLNNSYMVGDRISDIIAGHLAGCKTVQFLSGKHDAPLIETDLKIPEGIKPDYTIASLSELKGIILL